MTWVGLDVHARSTHAAAIDRESGELTRMRFGTGAEPVRADLARMRHRASTLLLRYGRVYDEGSAWTRAHRRWLAAQRFEHVPTELAYLDALAAIDGLLARRSALDERLSLLATEPEFCRPSPGCVASAGSRRSRRLCSTSRSATSPASSDPASSPLGSVSSHRC